MGLPFLLLQGGVALTATVTSTAAEIFGPLADPQASVTSVAGEVFGSRETTASVTLMVAEVFGPRREVTFDNAELAIGLSWLELTRPSDMS